VVDRDLPTQNPFHAIADQVRAAARGAGPSEVGIGDPGTTRDVSRRVTVAAAVVALATALATATDAAMPALPSLVNVCSGRATTFGELAEALAHQLGTRVVVRDLGWPRGGRIVGDPTRLRQAVGFPYVDRLPDLARSILGTEPLGATVTQPAGDHL
jgi:hypothetical protein